MFRKFVTFIICFAIIFSTLLCTIGVSAEEACTVTVETVEAATGDTIFVHLNIKDNPGIMAMTISITYNPDALEYIDYYYGDVFSDYTVAAHPTRKLIRLVIAERSDKTEDGTIASFKFTVKEDAEFDLHEMTVKYSSGDFCNSELERIMPKIVSGGVNVKYNGSNCAHKKYGKWTEEVAPTCTKEGVEKKVCEKCPHAEYRDTKPLGHEYSKDFTVDIPATEISSGTMSRHCKRCDSTTDETTFTLEQSDKGEIENTFEGKVPENEVVKDIIAEQHPETDTNSNKQTSQNEDSSSDKSSSSDSSSDNTSSEDVTEDKNENTIDTQPDDEETADSILGIISGEKTETDITYEEIKEKLKESIPQIENVVSVFSVLLAVLFLVIL